MKESKTSKWGFILKVIITVTTALADMLGLNSYINR